MDLDASAWMPKVIITDLPIEADGDYLPTTEEFMNELVASTIARNFKTSETFLLTRA